MKRVDVRRLTPYERDAITIREYDPGPKDSRGEGLWILRLPPGAFLPVPPSP